MITPNADTNETDSPFYIKNESFCSEFEDFIEYNDLGLPLAFAFAEGVINHTPTLEQYINETWDLFLEGLAIEDEGFARLEDIFVEE